MKKILASVMAICMTMAFSSCAKDNSVTEEKTETKEAVTLEKYTESKPYCAPDGTTVYTYEYDYLKTDEEKYPSLARKLDDMAQECEKNMNGDSEENSESYVAELVEAAIAHYNNVPESFSEYYDRKYYDVVRADKCVVSIAVTDSSYWGGAHPNSGKSGINIDVETGEVLTLDDISKNRTALENMIYSVLTESYDESIFFDNMKESLTSCIKNDSLEWVLEEDAIVFAFSPYVLAPYSEGVIEARIGFENNESLFKEKYVTKTE